MTLPTLRNWGLLQPGSRLLVLSRVDLTCGITLPQCLQRLVAPRTHLAREQAAHDPDHQENNGYPEEHHHAHPYKPPSAIHSKAVHHVRILLLLVWSLSEPCFFYLIFTLENQCVDRYRVPRRLIRV